MKRFFYFILTFLLSVSLFADVHHIVQKGETLYSISKRYNKSVQEIIDLNKLDGNSIKIGQNLLISKDSTKTEVKEKSTSSKDDYYVVQKGDTWYGISRANNISVAELQKLNGVDSNSQLRIGQKILLKGVEQKKVVKTETTTTKTTKTSTETKTTSSVSMTVTDTRSYAGKKGDSSLVWPVQNPEVFYLKGKISGVTLSAKKDEDVNSIREGTVMFAGSYRGFGNVVFVQSKTGHIYAYTGLGKISVSKGEYITYGSQLGTVGIDSYNQKSQITLMVFQNGNPIDPAKAPRG